MSPYGPSPRHVVPELLRHGADRLAYQYRAVGGRDRIRRADGQFELSRRVLGMELLHRHVLLAQRGQYRIDV